MNFTLKRHKSRPLLMQFNINMLVLGGISDEAREASVDSITEAITNPEGRYKQALVSLEKTIEDQRGLAEDMKSMLSPLTDAAAAVLDFSVKSLEFVQEELEEGSAIFDASTAPLLQAVSAIEQAGRNVFLLLRSVSNAGSQVLSFFSNAASMLGNAYCNIISGFGTDLRIPDFSDFFGASTCSSTGGGRPISPLANENPWLSLYEVDDKKPSANRSERAGNAVSILLQDPLSSTATESEILALADDMVSGIEFAAA